MIKNRKEYKMKDFDEVVKDIDDAEKNVDKVLKAGRLQRYEKESMSTERMKLILEFSFNLFSSSLLTFFVCWIFYLLATCKK